MKHFLFILLATATSALALPSPSFDTVTSGTVNTTALSISGTSAFTLFDASGAASTAQAFSIQRANHTGTQPASTITGLAAVATTGSYSNLLGLPTIPTNTNQLTNGAGYITSSGTALTITGTIPSSQVSGLATVATTGSYSSLLGTPTIPTNNNQLTNGAGYITATGTAATISGTLPASQVSGLASVATTGSFASLNGKPTTLSGYGITDAQPLDSDLTSIAALTTGSFGRSLLTDTSAAATRSTLGLGAYALRDSIYQSDIVRTQTINATSGTATINNDSSLTHVFLTGTLAAPLTLSLPAASGFAAGTGLTIIDVARSISSANTVTVTVNAGTDLLNSGTSEIVYTAGAARTFISNGINQWKTDESIPRKGAAETVAGAWDFSSSGVTFSGAGSGFTANAASPVTRANLANELFASAVVNMSPTTFGPTVRRSGTSMSNWSVSTNWWESPFYEQHQNANTAGPVWAACGFYNFLMFSGETNQTYAIRPFTWSARVNLVMNLNSTFCTDFIFGGDDTDQGGARSKRGLRVSLINTGTSSNFVAAIHTGASEVSGTSANITTQYSNLIVEWTPVVSSSVPQSGSVLNVYGSDPFRTSGSRPTLLASATTTQAFTVGTGSGSASTFCGSVLQFIVYSSGTTPGYQTNTQISSMKLIPR